MSAIGAIFGAGANAIGNLLTNAINRQNQREEDEYARYENYRFGELSAYNADLRTRRLYNDLYSPQAQIEQLKAAGLSPSLFYGKGGGMSGQTGAQGAGAAGVAPSAYGIQPIDFAQIALMNAQTRKINAEADTEEGTNERGSAQIANILQDTALKQSQKGNTDAATALTNIETEVKEIEKLFKQETFWTEVATINAKCDKVNAEVMKTMAEARSAEVKALVDEDTVQEQAEKIKNDVVLQTKEILLKDEQVKLTKKQQEQVDAIISKTYKEVVYMWCDLIFREDKFNQEILVKKEEVAIQKAKQKLEALGFSKEALETPLKYFMMMNNTLLGSFSLGGISSLISK